MLPSNRIELSYGGDLGAVYDDDILSDRIVFCKHVPTNFSNLGNGGPGKGFRIELPDRSLIGGRIKTKISSGIKKKRLCKRRPDDTVIAGSGARTNGRNRTRHAVSIENGIIQY